MDLSWLLGRSKLSFHHAENSISLTTKDGVKTNLLEICKSKTPPCHLNPLLFNGHLQTCWTAMKETDIPIYYKRKIFEADDKAVAGSFAVDFVVDPFEEEDGSLPPRTVYYSDSELNIGSNDSNPMLVTLHGLSGGSYEFYLRHVLAPLVTKEAGWEACVVNSRGCAMSKTTSRLLYNARSTWDLRQTVKWLRKVFPNRPLFGLGFSLGANIMTNYVGEEGDGCVLKAAVVISNPWNLEVGHHALQSSFLGREIYSRTMADNLKNMLSKNEDQVAKNPGIRMDKLKNCRYLYEFDREFQCPTWGYPTVYTYYRDASSCDSLLSVKIPFVGINAEDDPIAAKAAIPFDEFAKNPNTVLISTSTGGHLAWFEIGGSRWFVKPITAILESLAKDIDLGAAADTTALVANGGHSTETVSFTFSPMRRRLQLYSKKDAT